MTILTNGLDFRGPFTHDPAPVAGEARVEITEAQYAALSSLRAANPGKLLVFDSGSFRLPTNAEANAINDRDPDKKARRQAQPMLAKLDAGTQLTEAEQDGVLKFSAQVIRKLVKE